MRCAVCFRQARGFGWCSPRESFSNRQVFCSRRCQDAFSRIMDKTRGEMIDKSEMEIAALSACLAPLGEYVGSIGMQRPLADYRKDEVLTLIEVVVTAYQDRMTEQHEYMAERERAFLEERLARRVRGES